MITVNKLFSSALLITALLLSSLLSPLSNAASQCSGLSNSKCSSNSSCTWRKASVDKNGRKTKAHCRALPNKAKNSKAKNNKTKTSTIKKKTGVTNSKTEVSKAKAKKKTKKSKTKKNKTTSSK